MFCFQFERSKLGQLKGQEDWILEDNLILKQSYRLNEVERALVQARTIELLDVALV